MWWNIDISHLAQCPNINLARLKPPHIDPYNLGSTQSGERWPPTRSFKGQSLGKMEEQMNPLIRPTELPKGLTEYDQADKLGEPSELHQQFPQRSLLHKETHTMKQRLQTRFHTRSVFLQTSSLFSVQLWSNLLKPRPFLQSRKSQALTMTGLESQSVPIRGLQFL